MCVLLLCGKCAGGDGKGARNHLGATEVQRREMAESESTPRDRTDGIYHHPTWAVCMEEKSGIPDSA